MRYQMDGTIAGCPGNLTEVLTTAEGREASSLRPRRPYHTLATFGNCRWSSSTRLSTTIDDDRRSILYVRLRPAAAEERIVELPRRDGA